MKKVKIAGSTFDTTTIIKDSAGNSVTIPGGFKISSDSATRIDDGIVIEDHKGNQFVWIPVSNLQQLERKYLENSPNIFPDWGINDLDDWRSVGGGYSNERTVAKGGFYLGRFITGVNGSSYVCKDGFPNYMNASQKNYMNVNKTIVSTSFAASSTPPGGYYDRALEFMHGKRTPDSRVFSVTTKFEYTGGGLLNGVRTDRVANIYSVGGGTRTITAEVAGGDATTVMRAGDQSNIGAAVSRSTYYANAAWRPAQALTGSSTRCCLFVL